MGPNSKFYPLQMEALLERKKKLKTHYTWSGFWWKKKDAGKNGIEE